MRERNRAKCRLAGQAAIQLQAQPWPDRPIVLRTKLHEQVMWMLPVHDRRVVAQLSARQQVGIAAAADRERLEAEHRAERQPALAEWAAGHAHHPVDRSELLVAT